MKKNNDSVTETTRKNVTKNHRMYAMKHAKFARNAVYKKWDWLRQQLLVEIDSNTTSLFCNVASNALWHCWENQFDSNCVQKNEKFSIISSLENY